MTTALCLIGGPVFLILGLLIYICSSWTQASMFPAIVFMTFGVVMLSRVVIWVLRTAIK